MAVYTESKKDILKLYSDFELLIKEIKIENNNEECTFDGLIETLKARAAKIKKDKFTLMVVGEAKSGKSTFINAYLGEDVLPTDILQCTSSMIEIKYGDEYICVAEYADKTKETITGIEQIDKFLKTKAAVDDRYRDIPFTVINDWLVRVKDQMITDNLLEELIDDVRENRSKSVSEENYNQAIRAYITEQHNLWKKIIRKISISYPFSDEGLRDIVIIDTPGINADGRIGEVTEERINESDAIIFVKLSNEAVDSTSFNEFINRAAVEKNKDLLFLIFSYASALGKNARESQMKRALEIFPHILKEDHVLFVDSKLKCYYNLVERLTVEEIEKFVIKMREAEEVTIANMWIEADKDRDSYLRLLLSRSRFENVFEALNGFGAKAHYFYFSEFLKLMGETLDKIKTELQDRIDDYNDKAKDPTVLAQRIKEQNRELDILDKKLKKRTDEIWEKYISTNGEIEKRKNEIIESFKSELDKIDVISANSLDELEEALKKCTFHTVERVEEYENKLIDDVVVECNSSLMELANGRVTTSSLDMINATLTEEDFDRITAEIKSDNPEYDEWKTGKCGKKIDNRIHARKQYFAAVRDYISSVVDDIADKKVEGLITFVKLTVDKYSEELSKNIKIKIKEKNALIEEEQSNEQIIKIISKYQDRLNRVSLLMNTIKSTKGGIDQNV